MFKVILSTLALVITASMTTGFILSRGVPATRIKMHTKDLPEHGLTLMNPSDPVFDERLTAVLNGIPNDVADAFKPFSVFLENRSQRTVVGYMIVWCFTSADGRTKCHQKALNNPIALMEGGEMSEALQEQSGRIKPKSSRLLSLMSLDGSGSLSVTVTQEEAEQFKKGNINQKELLRRYSAELARYTDVTVTIDGAFFDDGTFVGPDTTGFFAQTEALIGARKDLLDELSQGTAGKNKEEVFRRIEVAAGQPEIALDSKSTPADYYSYFKRSYAKEVLQMRKAHGDEKALVAALRPMKKLWPTLRKKQGKE